MDTTINPVSGTTQQYTPVIQKVSTDSVPTFVPAAQPIPVSVPADTSSQYEASLRQAALSFKNVYAVSDQDFTIFKDVTGKYITRYVSLRDGKVTYVPEPTLVKQMQMSGGNVPPQIAISA